LYLFYLITTEESPVDWLAGKLNNHEIAGSNLGPKSGFIDWGF